VGPPPPPSSSSARAYATGDQVAFAAQPDLHTAAHEAAHVMQQRGGVQLKGGLGLEGDEHEAHADAVADRVVRGEPAADLLARYPFGGSVLAAAQRAPAAPGARPAIASPVGGINKPSFIDNSDHVLPCRGCAALWHRDPPDLRDVQPLALLSINPGPDHTRRTCPVRSAEST
jgi:Domain of unknown function (DUF4157)